MLPFLLVVTAWAGVAAIPPENLIPARWPSADPGSLRSLEGSPINCLLNPEEKWSHAFVEAAHAKQLTVLGVLRPGAAVLPRTKRALEFGLDGVVLEGAFAPAEAASVRKASPLTVELGPRNRIPLGGYAPAVIGTFQGVWAGINPQEEGSAKAAPSGAPWIDTNTGFLRFVRANTNRPFWLGANPPAKTVVTLPRYLQMIADAGMVGARWVVDLERGYFDKLVTGDAKTGKEFQRINQLLAFFEQHRGVQRYPAAGQLAVVEDVQDGALLSGGVLDMISVKHTPVRPVPFAAVTSKSFERASMAVNVDPRALNAEQQKVLGDFARAGGAVLTAPPGWKMPPPREDQSIIDADDVKRLDEIWKEVNSMTGRRNFGVRLFNVSSMLSNLLGPVDGSRLVLYLVNYSDFPVDTIAVHLLGKYSKATLYWPERPPKALALYENEDGSGVDVDILESAAVLIVEKYSRPIQ